MDKQVPKFDTPSDFMVGNYTSANELEEYLNLPCKIKAGIFIFCLQGNIRSTINVSEYTIKKNDIITIVPNSFIQVHEISPDIHLYYAAFSSNFMGHVNFIKSTMNCLSIIYTNPVMPLSEETALLYIDFYSVLVRSFYNQELLDNKEITKAVFELFSQWIAQLYHTHDKWVKLERSRDTEIYQEFLRLAMEHYTTQRKVSFYAGLLGLSLSYFCTAVKRAIGRKPLEIIAQIIIMDAKAQLKATDLTIKEIAFELGFNNLSFFNKFFRQHVGMTPQEYRGK